MKFGSRGFRVAIELAVSIVSASYPRLLREALIVGPVGPLLDRLLGCMYELLQSNCCGRIQRTDGKKLTPEPIAGFPVSVAVRVASLIVASKAVVLLVVAVPLIVATEAVVSAVVARVPSDTGSVTAVVTVPVLLLTCWIVVLLPAGEVRAASVTELLVVGSAPSVVLLVVAEVVTLNAAVIVAALTAIGSLTALVAIRARSEGRVVVRAALRHSSTIETT